MLPTFNLTIGIWRGSTPLSDPPDLTTPGKLVLGEPALLNDSVAFGFVSTAGTSKLYVPKLTDIRGTFLHPSPDVLEIPLGSGRRYFASFVDDYNKGLSDEYRLCVVRQAQITGFEWPVPMP